jgi:hypothetical protein
MAHAPSPVGCPSIFLAPRARGVSAVTRDLRTGLDELFAYFGMFLSSVTKTGPDGKSRLSSRSAPGSDIQSIFFDMSRQDHLDAALNEVPGDLVTASTSSLDLDITLTNAEFQLDRVAASGRTQEARRRERGDIGPIQRMLNYHGTLVRKRNDRSTRSTICAAAWIVSGCCVKPGRGNIYPAISRATSS